MEVVGAEGFEPSTSGVSDQRSKPFELRTNAELCLPLNE